MSSFFKSLRHIGTKFDAKAERFVFRHPHAAVFTMFIVLPVFILAAVSLLTMLVTLPVALLFG